MTSPPSCGRPLLLARTPVTWTMIMLLVLLVTPGWVAEACKCIPQHPQVLACNADFVIRAVIKEKIDVDPNLNYKFELRNIYKCPTAACTSAIASFLLETSASSAACGFTDLELDTEYLITGYISTSTTPGSVAHISTCGSFVRPWADLSPLQKLGFQSLYYEGCTCKLSRCPDTGCPDPPAADTCNWTTLNTVPLDCQALHAMCIFTQPSGPCAWRYKCEEYDECSNLRG